MGKEITDVIRENLNEDLIEMIISNSSDKDKLSKIKIRPVLLKQKLVFQSEQFIKKQVFHQNSSMEELLTLCENWFDYEKEAQGQVTFRQVQIQAKDHSTHILVSKKGKATIKTRKSAPAVAEVTRTLTHNRKKSYLIEEGVQVPFLVDLGVMTREGKIVHTKYDKYRQINRFLEYVEDIIPELDHGRELTIIDFGCGKSYLTFAMYYYLHELKGLDVRMIGLDLKEEVINNCNELSRSYGYDKLEFQNGDIATFTAVDAVDMVVTLHACDTATDYALYKAIKWNAKVILSVPCCQHELNGQMESEELAGILKYGLIRERSAALFTDAIRANLLEAAGYRAQILEFIDMEHTPKNILIRGVRAKGGAKQLAQVEETMRFLHVTPTLYQLLKEDEDVKLC